LAALEVLALYLAKRVGLALAVWLVLVWVLILAIHLVPGNPANYLASAQGGAHPPPAYVKFIRDQLDIGKPATSQFWGFLDGLFHGNLGRDFVTNIPVSHLILGALPNTLILALASVVLSVVVGVPFGILLARHPNTLFDRAGGALSLILISGLPYVMGLFLLLVFGVELHWVPTYGTGSLSHPLDYLRHLILPALSLALPWWGYLPRLVRASMLEVLGSPYIRTHRAFGVWERLIFYKYATKNALVPVVAIFGLMLGYGLAGTLYAEAIFTRVGLGSLALGAVLQRNWPVIRATVLLYALFYVAGNLLSDISYRFLDPRIRVEEGEAGA
jgi:peptide/nickel transport system permease protein